MSPGRTTTGGQHEEAFRKWLINRGNDGAVWRHLLPIVSAAFPSPSFTRSCKALVFAQAAV